MKSILRSAFAGAASVGLTGTFSSLVTALTFVDEEAPNPALRVWADLMLRSAGVETEVFGLEHLPTEHFVLAVNHQSHFDAPVLFRHIHRHMRFVAKAQLRKVPFLGYALKRAGNIFVDRTGSGKDAQRLESAATQIRERVSVVFFAEGTRSDTGALLPFKKGAAAMAIAAQVPLVPAAIAGTHQILKKGSVLIHPSPAVLTIGQPLPTTGLSTADRDRLTKQAHQRVAEMLKSGNDWLQLKQSKA